MLGIIFRWKSAKTLVSFLMAVVLLFGSVGCGDRAIVPQIPGVNRSSQSQIAGEISEVAPPSVIQQLRPALETYQPQVKILSPQADEILPTTTVKATFQVQDLPIFKNPDLGLGPHLHVILDNQPYEAVYDLDQPLVLENLAPGTHTLRVFASRPWHESFKNEGAYTQTTFHVFTKTTDNTPDRSKPLLTYSRPKGTYGAEPILLDFYLTNAPLHLVAQENPEDEIADWRIRVTVNGESFVLDKWQPIYLKGFKRGENWVHLEFLDELGNPVKNEFNDTVRVISYEPKGKDTLSKLVRGDISAESARGIVNPNVTLKPSVPTPEIAPTPEITPEPFVVPTPSVEVTPEAEVTTPQVELTEPVEPAPVAEPKASIFNRFRRGQPSISPSPTLPEVMETPTPEVIPQPEEVTPPPTVTIEETPTVEITPEPEPVAEPKASIFNRFRRGQPSISPSPTLPEVMETPTPEVIPQPEEVTPPPTATIEEAPTPEVATPEQAQPSLFSRFRRPTVFPSSPSTLPEIVEPPLPEPIAPPETENTPVETPVLEQGTDLESQLDIPTTVSDRPLRIIQAPAKPTVPSRFFKKAAPVTPTLEIPEATDADTSVAPEQGS